MPTTVAPSVINSRGLRIRPQIDGALSAASIAGRFPSLKMCVNYIASGMKTSFVVRIRGELMGSARQLSLRRQIVLDERLDDLIDAGVAAEAHGFGARRRE